MGSAPTYKADDRSLLLPYFKRFVVEPTLPFLPASLHPNSITHFGHVVNLLAAGLMVVLQPRKGWVFIAAMLLLQAYNWADNADGAHARRTKQSSAFGEFLDHGLDMLNTSYIGLMTVMAIDSTPLWMVILVAIIPGAAAHTCWEQTETGVFRMGLLNQIESVVVLSGIMVLDAVMGLDFLHTLHVGPLSVWLFLHVWPLATISFGMVRGLQRVAAEKRSVAPAVVFFAAHASVFACAMLGAIGTVSSVLLVIAISVFWGTCMLRRRILEEPVRIEPALLAVVGILGACGALVAGKLLPASAHGVCDYVGFALTSMCAALTIHNVRASVVTLARVEPA
jgi:phosphatidylglycerophosphate synthase